MVQYVLANARKGDVGSVLDTIDRFAYEESFLINVGDEKGELLDAAVRRANPKLALELGTYCGYGALRIAAAAPTAHVYSVELAAANAVNARRIWEHAGVADRITCVVGTIGDGGKTLDTLAAEHGFGCRLRRLPLSRSRQERLPERSTQPRCRAGGCARGRSSLPTMSRFRERRNTVPTCASSKAAPGRPSSTRPTASTERSSPTWCSSRCTSARRLAANR